MAGTGLYIPADVELLEGDMPVYGEKENVAPLFEGSGLGEPLFVEFGDLAKMLIGLRRLLPAGTRLTYNYDYERAWVGHRPRVDLPSFAERVRTLVWEDEVSLQVAAVPARAAAGSRFDGDRLSARTLRAMTNSTPRTTWVWRWRSERGGSVAWT